MWFFILLFVIVVIYLFVDVAIYLVADVVIGSQCLENCYVRSFYNNIQTMVVSEGTCCKVAKSEHCRIHQNCKTVKTVYNP
jgi:hypothetical protein